MSNGQRIDDLISAYHDGELTAADRDLAERLLEESADARTELDDYRSLSAMLSDLPREAAPTDLRDAVMRQITRMSVSVPPGPSPTSPTSHPQHASNAPHGEIVDGRSFHRRGMRRLWLLAGGLTSAAAVILAVNLYNGDVRKVGHEVAISDAVPPATEFSAGSEMSSSELAATRDGVLEDISMPMAASDAPGLADPIRILHDEAQPPEDVLPGDIYRYFEHSSDGVVVVDATVVDVRKAIGRVQYLLQTNSIPTVPVDATSDEFDHFHEAANGTAANDGWGVYIETDPDQMNQALQALNAVANEDENLFLDFKVAGVLDEPPAAYNEQRLGMRLDRRLAEPPPRSDVPTETPGPAEAATMAASSNERGQGGIRSMGARSRFSIPGLERPDPGPGAAPAAGGLEAESAIHEPENETANEAPSIGRATMPRSEGVADADEVPASGYQQVLQLSKEQLQQQMRPTSRTKGDFSESIESERSASGQADTWEQQAILQRQFEGAEEATGAAKAMPPYQRRTVRLLLMMEADPAAARESNAGITPVEAPR